jgi:hypothetical protein
MRIVFIVISGITLLSCKGQPSFTAATSTASPQISAPPVYRYDTSTKVIHVFVALCDNRQREAIILACISKKYFATHLAATKARPLLWSTGLMSPEAYTLHDALEAWLAAKPRAAIHLEAAKAYSRYQHCSMKAATNLLTGE